MLRPDKEELASAALDYRKQVGKHLSRLRNEMNSGEGMNQDDFAYKAGLHRSHVGKIENATLNVTIESLYKYARGLEMDVWEMLRLEDDSPG